MNPQSNRSLAAVLPSPHVARLIVAQGAIAGCFGAGALAIWFLLVDALVRQPMWSPSLVGNVILNGASVTAPVAIDLSAVAIFSIVHCLLFAGFGIVMTFALNRAGIRPLSLVGVALLAAALQAGVVVTTGILAPGLGGALGWMFVTAGNAVAAVTMAICLNALPAAE